MPNEGVEPEAVTPANPADHLTADAKFTAYAEIYKNLDAIMWQNIATLLGITVFGLNIVATLAKDKIALMDMSANSTIGLVLLTMAALYVVTILTMSRFHFHHLRMDGELSNLEIHGYFAARKRNRRWWVSAPAWNMGVFSLIAAICTLGGLIELSAGDWLWLAH